MKQLFTISLLLLSCYAKAQQSISFTITMPQPATHVFHVEMVCDAGGRDTLELKMPVWMPGYYQLMNYAEHVSNFKVTATTGELVWRQNSANSWVVNTGKAKSITINYDITATRSFVATSFLDTTHAYIASPGVFLHPAGRLKNAVTVSLQPYAGWTAVATGLTPVKGKPCTFTAPDFDVLYDCPILLGGLDSLPAFTVKNVPHYFVAWKPGDFDRAAFIRDMQKIVTAASDIIGDIPYPFYVFMGLGGSPGGIEHANSACVSFTGEGLKTEAGKVRMYSFLAHEYFHHYNVKRIRPIELGPFDYDHGSKTKMLWLSEGITVYYEYIILKRAGLISQQTLLELFSQSINAYESKPGRWHQTPAEASWETWTDGPFGATGERANKTISPYDKGPALGMLLDFKIRHATNNRRSLDDLMRLLYRKYYQQLQRGFTEAEFRNEAEKVAGVSLADFFDYIYTVKKVDYATYMGYAGLSIDGSFRLAPVSNPGALQKRILMGWGGD